MTRQLGSSCHEKLYTDSRNSQGESMWSLSVGTINRALQTTKHPLQGFASGGHNSSDKNAAYVLWPPSGRYSSSPEERAAYFSGLLKNSDADGQCRAQEGRQATTLLDLMTIRAFHSKSLRLYSLGTALGFRTRAGVLTNIPAVIVFVGRKVHKQWLLDAQKFPTTLQGPGGVWCDVDVMEFSYYGTQSMTPREQLYTELVEGLRGSDGFIGSGSQVASQETYGTLGGIVRSLTPGNDLGFLTNRHVAVDLDYPHQKMFHPLPPSLGPGVYLGSVERATSFITDDLWYGGFAGLNSETFIRADGAFIPFADTFDLTKITADLKGVGKMGELFRACLHDPIGSVVGKPVMKVGRSTGLTRGTIRAFAVDYNDEKGICYFTDFLVVGENEQPFDLEGDSGSLILLTGPEHEPPRPFGIIWGGSANRGRLKLRCGRAPENWTSCVDLGRLLDILQLELITSQSYLAEAIQEHRQRHVRFGSASPTDVTDPTDLTKDVESFPARESDNPRRTPEQDELHSSPPPMGPVADRGPAGPGAPDAVEKDLIPDRIEFPSPSELQANRKNEGDAAPDDREKKRKRSE